MNLKQAKELVRSRLSDKRYEHTLNVKKMAVKLAKIYGEDEERAALAALLHDSAKEISKDEMREILRAYPQYAEGGEGRPAPVWHGVCAAILARTQWGVTDEAVLSAIACHTAGKPGMTRLDKILYLADMTSAERDWPAAGRMNGESTDALKQAETENGLQISSDNAILKSMTGLQEHFFAGPRKSGGYKKA